MAGLRHFSDMTEHEMAAFQIAVQDAAMKEAKRLGISGLSEAESHNLYHALQDAVRIEWERSRRYTRKRSA